MYRAFEESSQPQILFTSSSSTSAWDLRPIKDFVRQVVLGALANSSDHRQRLELRAIDDENIFGLGADSLVGTYIRNSIIRGLRTRFKEMKIPMGRVRAVPQDFVYHFPSINMLSAFIFGVGVSAMAAPSEHDVNDEDNTSSISHEDNTFQWPRKLNQRGDLIIKVHKGRGEPPLIVLHGDI